ncbi:MAG: MBL fold metallo-hydrolase [Bellilinea sp.]
MQKIILLGTSNAVPAEGHENSHLLIQNGRHLVLVDCGANPVIHLKKGGIDFNHIEDIILTHFHPDHVSGAPLLLMDWWLMGRKKSLNVHGLVHTISRLRAMMDLYDWGSWPNFFPVRFTELVEAENQIVLAKNGLVITSSPVQHLLPTIGIRVQFGAGGKIVAYSSDTEPSDAVVRLARGADILIHEATGGSIGHTSARQAGEIARQAGVKHLYLIHYPVSADAQQMAADAGAVFDGGVTVSCDFMEINLD